jgi:hypothetical protein
LTNDPSRSTLGRSDPRSSASRGSRSSPQLLPADPTGPTPPSMELFLRKPHESGLRGPPCAVNWHLRGRSPQTGKGRRSEGGDDGSDANSQRHRRGRRPFVAITDARQRNRGRIILTARGNEFLATSRIRRLHAAGCPRRASFTRDNLLCEHCGIGRRDDPRIHPRSRGNPASQRRNGSAGV